MLTLVQIIIEILKLIFDFFKFVYEHHLLQKFMEYMENGKNSEEKK